MSPPGPPDVGPAGGAIPARAGPTSVEAGPHARRLPPRCGQAVGARHIVRAVGGLGSVLFVSLVVGILAVIACAGPALAGGGATRTGRTRGPEIGSGTTAGW